MACRPHSTELRHATAVLDTVDAARSVAEFLRLTLEALDEHVGIRRSAFMLGLAEGRLPGPTAYAGLQRGLRPHVMEEYFSGGPTSTRSPPTSPAPRTPAMDGPRSPASTPGSAPPIVATSMNSFAATATSTSSRWIDGVLSARESQVAELVAQGFPNRVIAAIMCIEEDTVKKHVAHAAGKLDVRGRTQLAVCWRSGQRLDLPVHPAARSATIS